MDRPFCDFVLDLSQRNMNESSRLLRRDSSFEGSLGKPTSGELFNYFRSLLAVPGQRVIEGTSGFQVRKPTVLAYMLGKFPAQEVRQVSLG
jgi:hypothetical protein